MKQGVNIPGDNSPLSNKEENTANTSKTVVKKITVYLPIMQILRTE